MSAIYTLGIDVGSTASKCIMLKDGQEIVAKYLIDVGAGTSVHQRALDTVLENAGMKKDRTQPVFPEASYENQSKFAIQNLFQCF